MVHSNLVKGMNTHNSNWTERFVEDGFALCERVVAEEKLQNLTSAVSAIQAESSAGPGLRFLLKRSAEVREFANSDSILNIVRQLIGTEARPVKAILFDKTPETNWYVTWHQDLTIATKQRIDMPGFGPWSVKFGVPHVQPPHAVLENIVALRIHLDDCNASNGAIKFIAGSHRSGVLSSDDIEKIRTSEKAVTCEARRGDVIAMRLLILHSSSVSNDPTHRRVLHIEYTASDLPNGLAWAEG